MDYSAPNLNDVVLYNNLQKKNSFFCRICILYPGFHFLPIRESRKKEITLQYDQIMMEPKMKNSHNSLEFRSVEVPS